jgi:hypothetical protein
MGKASREKVLAGSPDFAAASFYFIFMATSNASSGVAVAIVLAA